MMDAILALSKSQESMDGLSEKTNPLLSVPLVAYSLYDFLNLSIPQRKMLLSPWLTEKGLAMIYAARGIGKTFLGLTVAYAIATGGEFLGFKAPQPRRVLYVDGEMAASDLQERVKFIAAGFPLPPPNSDYFRVLSADVQEYGLPDLATPEGLKVLDLHTKEADLIVLDNLSTLVRSGKENEAEAWNIMQAWALEQRRAGRSVLFIHHAGKNGGQRGSSKREDVLDTIISLSRPEGYRASDGARFNVRFEKARHFHGQEAEEFEARYEVRDEKALWSRQKIPTKIERGLEAVAEGLSLRAAEKATGLSKSTIQRRRRQAKETIKDSATPWDMNPVPASQPLSRGTVGQPGTPINPDVLVAELLAEQQTKPPSP